MSNSSTTSRASLDVPMTTTATIATVPTNSWTHSASMNTNRQSSWPTGHYDPFSSIPVPRKTPSTFNVPESYLSGEGRGVDWRPLMTHSDPVSKPLIPQQQPSQRQFSFVTSEPAPYPRRESSAKPRAEETRVRRPSQDSYGVQSEIGQGRDHLDLDADLSSRRGEPRFQTRRRPFNQDEFDGPSQLLPLPTPQQEHLRSQTLPPQPMNLSLEEQDEVLRQTNDLLAQCAFHFVAKYQFPVPLERDKPRVRAAGDREWTEWAYLLKRLATKRRIPARVLYDNQIKQLVTTLENSITVRQVTKTSEGTSVRTLRDDRYILQLISSGIQVARILMDSLAMKQLDELYAMTEAIMFKRRTSTRAPNHPF